MFRVSNTIFPGKLREVCWPLHISNAGYWTNSEGCTVLMADKLPCCNAIKLNANGLEGALTSKPLCEYKYTSFTAKSWQTMNFHRIRRFYTSQMWKLKSFFADVLIKSYAFISTSRFHPEIYWLPCWKKQLPAESASWSTDLRGGRPR